MMHGELNKDRLSKVIEQILNERNENITWKVTIKDKEQLISEEDKDKSK